MADVKLLPGAATKFLAETIADEYGLPLGKIDIQKFSDGEFQPSILESVRGSFVFLIQSTVAPSDNLLELLLMIDAAKRASAGYITAVIPYFGYARQDRKDKPRVAIGAKLVANILQAAGADRVMTMDFHADQLQGFFDIPVDHLKGQAIFIPYLESMGITDNFIFAAPDVGGVKRARSYAKYFNTELVICDKVRKKANVVDSMTVIGDVKGRDVILVDDLIDTGGTLCKAAKTLLEDGANSVRAICTHAVLSGNAYKTIDGSLLKELIVTDTIPLKQKSKKIKQLPVAKLFARAIRYTHEYRSIASLFVDKKEKTLFNPMKE